LQALEEALLFKVGQNLPYGLDADLGYDNYASLCEAGHYLSL
jgi:hypothetical protein